jgi:hypothetical protein
MFSSVLLVIVCLDELCSTEQSRDAGETGTEPAAESGVSLRERSEWWDGVRVNPLERGGVTGGGETLSREDLLSVAEAVARDCVALGDDSIADEVSRAVESSREEEAERGEGWGASASSSRETIREVGGGRRLNKIASWQDTSMMNPGVN